MNEKALGKATVTPTDDEREALVAAIDTVLSLVLPPNARAVLESALRRSEVPEPSGAIYDAFGTVVTRADTAFELGREAGRSEPSADLAICGCHRDGSELVTCARHTVPEGEPSDAQVEAARDAYYATWGPHEIKIRAALRAAGVS